MPLHFAPEFKDNKYQREHDATCDASDKFRVYSIRIRWEVRHILNDGNSMYMYKLGDMEKEGEIAKFIIGCVLNRVMEDFPSSEYANLLINYHKLQRWGFQPVCDHYDDLMR